METQGPLAVQSQAGHASSPGYSDESRQDRTGAIANVSIAVGQGCDLRECEICVYPPVIMAIEHPLFVDDFPNKASIAHRGFVISTFPRLIAGG